MYILDPVKDAGIEQDYPTAEQFAVAVDTAAAELSNPILSLLRYAYETLGGERAYAEPERDAYPWGWMLTEDIVSARTALELHRLPSISAMATEVLAIVSAELTAGDRCHDPLYHDAQQVAHWLRQSQAISA